MRLSHPLRAIGGGLLTTEDETVELGVHAGHLVRGVVQRRVVRLGLGPRFRFAAVRLRPVAIEVDGARTPIAPPSEGRRQAQQRALLLLVLSIVVPRVIARLRARREVEE